MPIIDLTLYDMFLYLANAIITIPDQYKNKVFQDMAYKLIEWNGNTHDEIRETLKKFNIALEERCSNCNEPMPEFTGAGKPLCDSCGP